jgi:mono/diheme cytochrome c family protein
MRQQIKHHSISVTIVLAMLVAGAGVFIYSGLYNLGADDHHSKTVLALMQILRDRSIHVRSKDIKVPNLEDPQLILKGAGQYAAMCTGCHLTPGMRDSEIRPGLYPEPPNLSQVRVDPQDAFWVIKHGIKMSAMPAWGLSHDDPTIWSMVAFLQKLPDMTRAQYKDIVAKGPPDEDMDMDEGGDLGHDGRDADTHGTASPEGMDMSGETQREGPSQGAAADNPHPH